MMTILPGECCRKSQYILAFALADHRFKGERTQMVALIRNHHAIATDNIIDDPFLHQTLN